MHDPIDLYWSLKLKQCRSALEKNNFEAYSVKNMKAAELLVMEELIPSLVAKTVSWGGSQTLISSGILEYLKSNPEMDYVPTFEGGETRDEIWERCRQALFVDLYLSGANAVTETGILVNLDMWGNRVGALTFGPKHIIVLAGRNKIVSDLESAMLREKKIAAPMNALRHSYKEGRDTPCTKKGKCFDCAHPMRICNIWSIIEKCFPKKRIKVVLINEDIGY